MPFPFSEFIKQFFICPKKERIELGISSILLKQAKQGNAKAQLEIAGHYFANKQENYLKKSIYWFEQSANNQNADAMFGLATLYYRGIGVAQNIQQAVDWYAKAAKQGQQKAVTMLNRITLMALQQKAEQNNAEAMYELANHYLMGDIVAIDYPLAKDWYEKSAALKNIDALINLASIYDQGLGTPKNTTKAASLYLEAAQQENNIAMLNIGILFITGEGVAQDINQGIYWLSRAAQLGNAKASFNLGTLYFDGQLVKQDTNKAIKHFMAAAQTDHIEAMFNLGIIYQSGQGIQKDLEQASNWFERASALGHQQATDHLNISKLDQLAIEADKGNRKAIKDYINLCTEVKFKINNDLLTEWLYKSAKNGDSNAMVDIGNFFTNGIPPFIKDHQQAMDWYIKASSLENNQAMNLIGLAYLAGHGVKQDTQQAITWFKKSAALNNDKAMVNIANLYLVGTLLPPDYSIAHEWFIEAAKQHNLSAIQSLSYLYEHGLGVPKSLSKARYWQQQLQQPNKESK